MADFRTENTGQERNEGTLSTYNEFTPGTVAVIETQPTFISDVGSQCRVVSPLSIVRSKGKRSIEENTDNEEFVKNDHKLRKKCIFENSATDGQILPFHRLGTEVLRITDQLLIQQTVELLDLIAAVESENRYVIKVPRGDTIFEVAERSSGWQRALLGSARSFSLHVFDRSRKEVLQLHRKKAACSCCLCHSCCAFLQKIEIYALPYLLLGSVTQECSPFVSSFFVKNAAEDIMYKIEGPSYCFGMNMESTFKILTYDGTREVGSITNQWNDLQLQHNLRVIFPFEENSDMRAVLLGAAFLLQYMFFESSKKASRIRLS